MLLFILNELVVSNLCVRGLIHTMYDVHVLHVCVCLRRVVGVCVRGGGGGVQLLCSFVHIGFF